MAEHVYVEGCSWSVAIILGVYMNTARRRHSARRRHTDRGRSRPCYRKRGCTRRQHRRSNRQRGGNIWGTPVSARTQRLPALRAELGRSAPARKLKRLAHRVSRSRVSGRYRQVSCESLTLVSDCADNFQTGDWEGSQPCRSYRQGGFICRKARQGARSRCSVYGKYGFRKRCINDRL